MPTEPPSLTPLLASVVDRINVGIVILDARMTITLWNNFMEVHSGQTADDVIGRNLFDCFPDLPRHVIEHEIRSVFILKNFAFSSWEQRPYLFKFPRNRPVTSDVEYMYQDCTFIPIKNERGGVEKVCITLVDATDTAIYQKMSKAALTSLAEANRRDGLTGLYDRRFLEESLAREFSRARRFDGMIFLAMMDVDHLKSINESYGHLAGDDVLSFLANGLRASLCETEILGRYGGDEFGVLLPETTIDQAFTLVDRIRKNIADSTIAHGHIPLKVTISAGIAVFHPDMTCFEDLIKAADDALRHAKDTGRNRVIYAQQPIETWNTLRASENMAS